MPVSWSPGQPGLSPGFAGLDRDQQRAAWEGARDSDLKAKTKCQLLSGGNQRGN